VIGNLPVAAAVPPLAADLDAKTTLSCGPGKNEFSAENG